MSMTGSEDPWIDLRKKRPDYNYHFSVIRLRVVRDPFFYIFMDVLPLFLVIAVSFAHYAMSMEDFLGDKFSYLITLLLTTAAFQYSMNEDLPNTPELTRYTFILYEIPRDVVALHTVPLTMGTRSQCASCPSLLSYYEQDRQLHIVVCEMTTALCTSLSSVCLCFHRTVYVEGQYMNLFIVTNVGPTLFSQCRLWNWRSLRE